METIEEQINLKDIDAIVECIGRDPKDVIAILQAVQEKYNYLPPEALERICEITNITPAAVTGV